jgi:hypothetical protein
MMRVVNVVCLACLVLTACGRPPQPVAEPGHPLIGHWSLASVNGKPLAADAHVTVTFRECGCSTVNPHGDLGVVNLYDPNKIAQAFREYRGPAPAIGDEVRLAGEGFEVVVRRVDADAPACCQNRAADFRGAAIGPKR